MIALIGRELVLTKPLTKQRPISLAVTQSHDLGISTESTSQVNFTVQRVNIAGEFSCEKTFPIIPSINILLQYTRWLGNYYQG